METRDVTFKSGTGTPVADNPHILAGGPRDPLLHDLWLTDKLARVDREVTPERRMGAKEIFSATHGKIIRFGRFCVLPQARQLLIDGQSVELGSRAFDLLLVLIEEPGTLITKDEIIRRVWPNRVVEESNLKMQMSALRRILNADRHVIKTVHGRGYVFTSKVTTASSEPDLLAPSNFEPSPSKLGPPPTIVPNPRSTHPQSVTGSRMIATAEKAPPVIVVIDDDPDRRGALRKFLRAEGLCVEAFASMQELLDRSPASLSSSGSPDKAASRFKKNWPRQSCASRTSSAGIPMSPCRFGR